MTDRVCSPDLCPTLYGGDMDRRLVLVRRPSPRLAEGLLTHIDRLPVNTSVAMQQWENYVAAFENAGWEVLLAPDTPDCPDAAFIEDQVFVYHGTAILCRAGAVERQLEQAGIAPMLHRYGYRTLSIEAPGTLDGSDILKYNRNIWVGDGGPNGRSNDDGFRQLQQHLAPHDVAVAQVRNTKTLHLKSAMTALPNGTIIGWTPVLDAPSRWTHFMSVPEEHGAHVVHLDDCTLLMSAAAPRTAEMLMALGYKIVAVDISEFEKLEGSVTCLSVRLRN